MMPPAELVLSGIVRPTKEMLAGIGDVAIHPGSGRTPYIDATIFDGITWRALDLKGFGFSLDNRGFGHSSEIGPIMRQIERKIAGHKGSPVYYDYPANSKRR
ncbi:TPA: hypothetical protein ACXLAK_006320, partial [Pseudomonas aeruginosa]